MRSPKSDRDYAKYDKVTRCLHTALATSVVIELLLQAVMRVPAGRGLGVRDWHRAAFELHSHFGPTVAVTCALHWLWICLPYSQPGVGYLFPWRRRDRRLDLRREISRLVRFDLPPSEELSPLVGTIQGLGLLAVTASVAGGLVSYVGYYTRVPVPAPVLHWAALELIFTTWFVWLFVVGHVSMACAHYVNARRRLLEHPAQRS
jgi:cytochrome b561